MDVLRGYSSNVRFPVPEDLASAQFKVLKDGVQIGTTSNAQIASSVATGTVPYSATLSEGELSAVLTFTYQASPVTLTQTLNVYTPIIEKFEILEIMPDATDEEVTNIEGLVRHIIQAHCGQSFGYSEKTIVVEGHGEYGLRLPERLISVSAINTLTAVLDPNNSIIVSDGWYLKKGWTEVVAPLTTTNTYWSGYEFNNADPGEPGYEKPSHGPIIYPPTFGDHATKWKDDYPFTITGTWGYLSVPGAVREAAKLLVNDYACMEARYRDSYLEVVKAADWQLEFSSRAWEYTGNVKADQLLSEFVLLDWATI
jgi:hypothetical protein